MHRAEIGEILQKQTKVGQTSPRAPSGLKARAMTAWVAASPRAEAQEIEPWQIASPVGATHCLSVFLIPSE